jgi:hypothetical protein
MLLIVYKLILIVKHYGINVLLKVEVVSLWELVLLI